MLEDLLNISLNQKKTNFVARDASEYLETCGTNNNKMASITGLSFHKELGMDNYKMSVSYRRINPRRCSLQPLTAFVGHKCIVAN